MILDPIKAEAVEAAYQRLGALGSKALEAGGIGNPNGLVNTVGSGALSFSSLQRPVGGGLKRIITFATGEDSNV